jgi:DNA-binding SARP family transcriptional activator
MKSALVTTHKLSLHLLGGDALRTEGVAVALPTKRSLGILAMLALEGRVLRQNLAFSLWDELLFDDPRRNLRQELYRLSKILPEGMLVQTGETVFLQDLACDVLSLERAVHASDWIVAAAFDSELLPRFSVRDAPGFETWLGAQREKVRDLQAGALEGLAESFERQGDLAAALELRQRRLRLDPWNERDHRAVMRLLVQSKQTNKATAHFEALQKALKLELGLEPSSETVSFAATLQGQLEQKTEPQTTLLEAAVLLHGAFSWVELRGVTDHSDEQISALLDAAVRDGVLKLKADQYEFTDFERAARRVESLASGQRRLWHSRFARNLERLAASPERIAAQLEACGERLQAAIWWLRAAHAARRNFAYDSSLSYFSKASDLFPTPLEKLEALRGQVHIFELRNDLAARETVIAQMHDLSEKSGVGLPVCLLEKSRLQLDTAQFALALEGATDLLEDSRLQGADIGLANFVIGCALLRLGRMGEAKPMFETALKNASKLSSERAGAAYHLAVIAFQTGRFDAMPAPLELAARVANSIRHNTLRCNISALFAVMHNIQGHPGRASEFASQALELARAGGLKAQEQSALQILANVAVSQGQLEVALTHAEAALALPTTKYLEGVLQMTLVGIQTQRGHLGEALELGIRAIANADALESPPLQVSRRATLALGFVQYGRSALALVLADKALALFPELELHTQAAVAHLALALLELRNAQPELARARLEKLSFEEPDVEVERLVFWAQSCYWLTDTRAVQDAKPDFNRASRVQQLRWQIEVARANADFGRLESLAEELLTGSFQTLEALQARYALLGLRHSASLLEFHNHEIARLELTLALEHRSEFRGFWQVLPENPGG